MNDFPENSRYDHGKIRNYFVVISLLGTLLLFLLIWETPSSIKTPAQSFNFQQLLIFILFDLICLSGIIASLFPEKCFNIISLKNEAIHSPSKNDILAPSNRIKIEGHHPSCEHYKNHIIKIKNRKYCAGCTGLAIGAFLSILGSLIFLYIFSVNGTFTNLMIGVIILEILGITGILLVMVTLYTPLFWEIKKSIYKFLFSFIFVLGAFMGLLGIIIMNKTLSLGLYYLVLILIWIFTRIAISQGTHEEICQECQEMNCYLKKRH